MKIPKFAAWCANCLKVNPLIYPGCPYHIDGEDYAGPDVYEPSSDVLRVVGAFYNGPQGAYECTGYDPRHGFWMLNLDDPKDIRNVSERAIGTTFQKRQQLHLKVNVMSSTGLPPEIVSQFTALVDTPQVDVFSTVHNRRIGCAYSFTLNGEDLWAHLEIDKRFEDFQRAAGAITISEEGTVYLVGVVVTDIPRETLSKVDHLN